MVLVVVDAVDETNKIRSRSDFIFDNDCNYRSWVAPYFACDCARYRSDRPKTRAEVRLFKIIRFTNWLN